MLASHIHNPAGWLESRAWETLRDVSKGKPKSEGNIRVEHLDKNSVD